MRQGELLLALHGVSKDYRGLRPLRVAQLELRQGQSIAVLGFDQTMAEVLVDLITGATVPDAGEVVVFDHPTTAIRDADEWFRMLDQFGLLTDRAVLVEQFTAEQNLAMPLSLDVEEMPSALRARARQMAEEVGLEAAELAQPAGGLSASSRLRIRLGRALALGPRLLLAEHPNASLSIDEAPVFAADFARIIAARGVATLVLTADRTFARAIAEDVLTLEPATGNLNASAGWRRWFR
jgi:ABC-type lipoprotein export system ATPase subunit